MIRRWVGPQRRGITAGARLRGGGVRGCQRDNRASPSRIWSAERALPALDQQRGPLWHACATPERRNSARAAQQEAAARPAKPPSLATCAVLAAHLPFSGRQAGASCARSRKCLESTTAAQGRGWQLRHDQEPDFTRAMRPGLTRADSRSTPHSRRRSQDVRNQKFKQNLEKAFSSYWGG